MRNELWNELRHELFYELWGQLRRRELWHKLRWWANELRRRLHELR